jgi:hypothetical protein
VTNHKGFELWTLSGGNSHLLLFICHKGNKAKIQEMRKDNKTLKGRGTWKICAVLSAKLHALKSDK